MQWFWDVPVVTRSYLGLVTLVTLATYISLLRPYLLFFSPALIAKGEWYRLFSTFFYMGPFSMDWFLHTYFLFKYMEGLELALRTPDFTFMLVILASLITLVSLMFPTPFLSNCLVFALTYLWSRRNPDVQMGLFGIINFRAMYLCWVLVGFSVLVQSALPYHDLVGLFAGHVYFYLKDVYPKLQASGGAEPLKTPRFLVIMLQGEHDHDE